MQSAFLNLELVLVGRYLGVGCTGSTGCRARSATGAAIAGSCFIPITERASENSCNFITTVSPFVLPEAGGVKASRLMQSYMSVKVGSRKLCYCSNAVIVTSGFPLDLRGKERK